MQRHMAGDLDCLTGFRNSVEWLNDIIQTTKKLVGKGGIMSRPKSFRWAIYATCCLLAVGVVPARANLLINGGFEAPIVGDQFGGFEHRSGFELTGWESFSTWIPGTGEDPGSVHFNSNYSTVSEGNQAVQLEVPGDWIRESFATTIDQLYVLSFDLSAFHSNGGFLEVDVGNVSLEFMGTPSEYVSYSLEFMALTETTTLTFTSIGTLFTFPHIDNVSVDISSVPEPGTYALMLTGLGIMGFFARRKKRQAA